jgi:hypothetical protein
MVALSCLLIAGLVIASGSAAAESGDAAPLRSLSDGGLDFPTIIGPEAPEEYPFQVEGFAPEVVLRQIDDQLIVGEYVEGGVRSASFEAVAAHDADGATVPTTLTLGEDEVITLTVHYKAGNPAAGGAPFVFPITDGVGWSGGFFTGTVQMINPFAEAERKVVEANPAAHPEPPPAPTCKVPTLRGYSLRGAKNRLRVAHCGLGAVHLAAGATLGKGKVVKQFHPAGARLVEGSPVAVKLGAAGR